MIQTLATIILAVCPKITNVTAPTQGCPDFMVNCVVTSASVDLDKVQPCIEEYRKKYEDSASDRSGRN